MKRIISLTLCLALLFCLCSFSGCEKDEALSATGEYNGQKITMTYKVTDITYPWDMRGIHMSQGYAIYYDHTWLEEHPHASYDPHVTDAWNMIDQNGTPMIEEPYLDLMSFNSEGKTVARKQDGTYVSLNTKLKETPISYEEWLAFSANPENNPRLDAETIKIFDDGTGTSYVYEGLAIYVEPGSDKIMRAGLMDRDKNVIIPAFIPVCYSAMIETLYLFEDVAFVVDYETNKIGIVTVTRTPTNTENLTVLADEENYRVEMTEDQKFVYFYIRDNAGKVLEAMGLEVERDYDGTLPELMQALAEGEKILCAVDNMILYDPRFADMPGRVANHAVQLVAIDFSDPENPQAILNDTGVENGRGIRHDLDVFMAAWKTSGNFAVYAGKGDAA